MVVLMETAGHSVKRFPVLRRTFQYIFVGLGVALLLGVFMTGHYFFLRPQGTESRALRDENAQLKYLIAQLEKKMPKMRATAFQSELAFTQLWAKSGLGTDIRLPAMGPTDADTSLPATLAGAVNGEILALDPVALPMELNRVRQDGRATQRQLGEILEYFHDAQRLLSNTPSVRPVKTPWITSSFGRRRDPIFGTMMMHKGMDFGGYSGLEIFAPADGQVIFTGYRGGYGKTVVLDHGYGLQTHFAHLSEFRVSKGDRVRRGDLIAEMGSTGKSTGPHLHYEVRRMGHPLDPAKFVLD